MLQLARSMFQQSKKKKHRPQNHIPETTERKTAISSSSSKQGKISMLGASLALRRNVYQPAKECGPAGWRQFDEPCANFPTNLLSEITWHGTPNFVSWGRPAGRVCVCVCVVHIEYGSGKRRTRTNQNTSTDHCQYGSSVQRSFRAARSRSAPVMDLKVLKQS